MRNSNGVLFNGRMFCYLRQIGNVHYITECNYIFVTHGVSLLDTVNNDILPSRQLRQMPPGDNPAGHHHHRCSHARLKVGLGSNASKNSMS